MTDYPIPDELRDQFARTWANVPLTGDDSCWVLERKRAVRDLDEHVKRGAHIELRLPEFAVHDDTCCGGSMVAPVKDASGSYSTPCPSAGYYHWTVPS